MWTLAGYSTLGAGAWGAAVGPGNPYYVHAYFGSTVGAGGMKWMQTVGGLGGQWVTGASSSEIAGTWFTFTGVPILFPAAALLPRTAQSWSCVTSTIHSYLSDVICR